MNNNIKDWRKTIHSFYRIRIHVLFLLFVSIGLILVVSPAHAATFEISQRYGKFLDAGNEHSLALKSDGTVVAWGANDYGQSNVPEGLNNVVAIDAGGYHSLALKSDGTVVAWGINDRQTNIPDDLTDVVAIAAGGYHSVALKSDGTVVVMGPNSFGERYIPSGLNNVVAIDAGYAHILALKSDGTVVAWGYNDREQTNVPAGLTDVVAIDAGEYHSLALKKDGTVVAWGSNYSGQTNVPEGLTNVVKVDAAGWGSLALRSDGTVVSWGTTNIPVDLTELSDVVTISAGWSHLIALKSDGTVVAHGSNYSGQTNVPNGLKVGDVTSPTATILYSTINPTNKNVVASLNPSEPITVTNNGGSLSYTFTENGSFTFEFVDISGNIGSAVATVTNIDKTTPTATVTYTATDPTNQNVVATIHPSEPVVITNNRGSNQYLFNENGEFTYEMVDAAGNKGSITSKVSNIDKIAPRISVELDQPMLRISNHKMVTIKAALNYFDGESGIQSVVLDSIISNEPDHGLNNGDKPNDIQNANFGTEDTSFDLRAERLGTGNGRVYNVTYIATDKAGNKSIQKVTVTVPHDSGKN